MFPGRLGHPRFELWVVDPTPSEKGKLVLLHMHGGGLMLPDPVLLLRLQGIATDYHCVVVSVDYRLAPETRYPGSLEDNYAALKWVHAHAAELGIDRSKIAVGGESAGGALPTSWVCYATQLRSSDSERKNGSAFSAKIAPGTGGNTSKRWHFPSRTWHGIRLIKRLFKGESNPII